MIKTKTFLAALGLCMLALTAIPASAQMTMGGRGGGQRPDPVARLNEKLHLSAAQQTKIKAIFDDLRQQMQALPRDESSREQRQKLFASVEPKVMAVLTPAQRKAVASNGGLRGMMGRGRGGGGMRFEHALAAANVNPTQKKKIDAILAGMRKKMEAMRAGRQPGQMQVNDFNKMRDISNKAKADVEAVLTPVQRKKFEAAWDAERGGPGNGR